MIMNNKEKMEKEYARFTMNDMRIWLYEAGIDYPDDAKREDLIRLIEAARKK